MNFPLLVCVACFVGLWLSARIGASVHKQRGNLGPDERDFSVIGTGTLTLLSLIIGFSFSMATSRYEQRKNYEAAETNAIRSEYVRAELLPAADAARVRALLGNYLDQRVLFYQARDGSQLRQINAYTAQLQTELWSAVQAPVAVQQTPLLALVLSGMNDVLDSEGYTQAAWRNRIPIAAWVLMVAIAISCNLLIGYGAHRAEAKGILFLVFPFVVSISFFLIADIDSPRGGAIRVLPQNLANLSHSLHTH